MTKNNDIQLTAQQEEYQNKIKTIIIWDYNSETDECIDYTYESDLAPHQILHPGQALLDELSERYGGEWDPDDDENEVARQKEGYKLAQTQPHMKLAVCTDYTEYRRYVSATYPDKYPGVTILHADDYNTWMTVETQAGKKTYQVKTNNTDSAELYIQTQDGTFKRMAEWTPNVYMKGQEEEKIHQAHIKAYVELIQALG